MKNMHIAMLVAGAVGVGWWLSRKQGTPAAAAPAQGLPSNAQMPTAATMPPGTGPAITPVPEEVTTSGPSMEDIAAAPPVYDRGY